MTLYDVDQVNSLVTLTVFFPVIAAIASLAFMFIHRPRWLDRITPICSFLSLLATLLLAMLYARPVEYGWHQFNIQFVYIDSLSIYFMLLVNLVAFIVSWYSVSYLAYDKQHNPYHRPAWFHLLFNLFHITMLVVPIMGNLILLWIAVELTTVVSTILVRYRRDRRALEASWKFIITTTTGIIFALLGTLMVANSIPPIQGAAQFVELGRDPMSWSNLVDKSVYPFLQDNYLRLAFLFILIGYGTKAGLAPMHTWLPDGHGEAPSPVSALLSGVMLKSAMYAILRFYTLTNLVLDDRSFTSGLLLLAGLFSLALSTPLILKHNRFKRVLAYHSLEHMGIITFGLGIGTTAALFGALLHALNHAITKALMFTTYGYAHQQYTDQILGSTKKTLDENDVRGVWKAMPVTGSILAIGGLALVGSPPFNIFMSEFIILWAAIQRVLNIAAPSDSLGIAEAVGGQSAVVGASLPQMLTGGGGQVFWGLAVVIFLVSVSLIFVGMVRHLSRLLLGPAPFAAIESGLSNIRPLAPFLILLALVALFGLWVPNWIVRLADILRDSAKILIGGPLP